MKGLCFLISVFLLASCATLPAIQEPSADQTKKPVTCPSPFILEKTRFIHTIDVQAAGPVSYTHLTLPTIYSV